MNPELAKNMSTARRILGRVVVLAALCAILIGLTGHAAEAKQQIRTIRDAEIEDMLRDWSDPIFKAAGLTPSSVEIILVNDPSINAFVALGQNMFIHTGLINEADLPNEVVGVIAHETGHIAGGHLARLPGAAGKATTPLIVSLLLGAAAIAAGAPDVGAAVMSGGAHIAQRQILAYNRTQESAADQAAMRYLERTGQSSKGLLTFFDQFRDSTVMMDRSIDPYAQTHPMPQDRIASLEQRVAESQFRDRKDSPEEIHRLKMAQAKLHGFLDDIGSVYRRYPESDQSLPAHYARSIAYFREAKVEEALDELTPVFEAEPENPYLHELKSQILFESGRVKQAIPPARLALELAPDEPLLRIALGQALLASDEAGADRTVALEAKNNLEMAVREDPHNPLAWRQLAQAYARLGDEAMADLATAERYFAVGAIGDAKGFAMRARRKLKKGSEAWQRASDILVTGGDGEPGEETPMPRDPKRKPGFNFEWRAGSR
ncbi:MAG: M48 family metalloprotease [Alphaproteobacteria bacterium]